MKHLTENGNKLFVLGLRKQSDVIKEYTKFGGPPHPMHGNVPYLTVRKISKELCEMLYNADFSSAHSLDNNGTKPPTEFKYGGLGPVRSGGAIQGFGNSPTQQSKGIGETILDGIEKLGAKLSETAADRQAALLAKLDLGSSTSNYQPPVVCDSTVHTFHSKTEESNTNSSKTDFKSIPVKKHQPGKAGGGWGDDEDDNSLDDATDNDQFTMDTDSLADPSIKLPPEADWQEESNLVTAILRQGSTGQGKAYLTPSSVASFLSKCTTLSCDSVVELLVTNLSSGDAGIIVRSLQLLEGIIFNNEELISLDLLTSICKDGLITCYNNSLTHIQSDKETGLHSDQLSNLNQSLWSSVQMKSAKIGLILQQLSSQKEVIPSTLINNLFTTVS
ncbi:AP-4 complex accessory subunit Tepsin-like isoform X2 [Physella acuta]|nr:AP-4 complex accessory subunit Tepsin-like isoform X2 [Physella acuta]